jgi:hypothetical protein
MVTYMTAPEPENVLLTFYRSVRPHVAGWQPIAAIASDVPPTRDLGRNLMSWLLGCAMVYLALFGLGRILLGPAWKGIAMLAASAVCAAVLYANLSRQGWTLEQRKDATMGKFAGT